MRMQVDERVLRYILIKRQVFNRLPSTYKISRRAALSIHQDQWRRLKEARRLGSPLWWDPEVRRSADIGAAAGHAVWRISETPLPVSTGLQQGICFESHPPLAVTSSICCVCFLDQRVKAVGYLPLIWLCSSSSTGQGRWG